MPKSDNTYPKLYLKQNELAVTQHDSAENYIDDTIIKECIVANLTKYSNVDSLIFQNVYMTDSGFSELSRLLKDNQQLKKLALNHDATVWVHQAGSHNLHGQENYVIKVRRFYDHWRDQFYCLAGEISGTNHEYVRHQESTNFPYYRYAIGNDGANKVAAALQGNQFLTSLELCYQNILPQGIAVLAKVIEGHKKLTTLMLKGNFLGREGSAALAKMLKNNQNFAVFNVERCAIDDTDIKLLAEGLAHHGSLQVLNLSDNELSDVGVKIIADVLPSMKNLQSLSLEGNKLSLSGINSLLNTLVENSTISTFSVMLVSSEASDQTYETTAAVLKQLIEKNNTLTEFSLKGPLFSENDKGAKILDPVIKVLEQNYRFSMAKSVKILEVILEALEKNYRLTKFELPLSCELFNSKLRRITERNKEIQQAIMVVNQLIAQPLPTELEEQKKLKQQIDVATEINKKLSEKYPDFASYCQTTKEVGVAVAKFNKRSAQLEKLIKIHEELGGLETKVTTEFNLFLKSTRKNKTVPVVIEIESKWQKLKEQSALLETPEQELLKGAFSVVESKICFFKSCEPKDNQTSIATNTPQTTTFTKGSLNDD